MARFWCTVALVALMVLCKGAEAARLRASAKSLHGSSTSEAAISRARLSPKQLFHDQTKTGLPTLRQHDPSNRNANGAGSQDVWKCEHQKNGQYHVYCNEGFAKTDGFSAVYDNEKECEHNINNDDGVVKKKGLKCINPAKTDSKSDSAAALMNRPGQMMGIPAPEGSNFFHPDGLPTWMRPSALPQKFRSPAVPAGGGAMVPASMPVAPSMVRTIASHSAALDR